MRALSLAILALAGCTSPASAVPAAAAAPTAEASEPIAPVSPLAGEYRYVMSVSHEISCSRSFEHHGVYVTYDLAIGPTGEAVLKLEGAEHRSSGPSGARFSPGAQYQKESRPIAERWTGTATRVGDSVRVELASGGAAWRLACRIARVDAKLPYVEGASLDAKRSVEVLSCTPTRHVPPADAAQLGTLSFAAKPGLEASVHDYGHGSVHADVRLLRE